MTPTTAPTRARWTWWIVFFGLPTLFLSIFLRTSWRIGDEGSIVYGAQRVAEGAVPYRDFFEVMGPGTFYWLALWFKVLGTTWVASRLEVLATILGSVWAIYFITTREYRGRFALLPAFAYTVLSVPLWPGTNHHFDSNLWALLAVAAYVRTPHFSYRWSALAGVLAALSSTVIPHKGVLIVTALVAAALVAPLRARDWPAACRAGAALLVPFAGVGLVVVAFFQSQGALDDLLYAQAVWPATQYHSVTVAPYAYGLRELFLASWSPGLRAVFRWPVSEVMVAAVAAPLVFIAALPLVATACALHAAGAARGWMRSVQLPPAVYWCAGPALFLAECHRPDLKHLAYGSPLLLALFTIYAARSQSAIGVGVLRMFRGCTALVAVFVAVVALQPGITVETRSGLVRMFEKDEALEFLQTSVRAGESAFVYPYYPMYLLSRERQEPDQVQHPDVPHQHGGPVRGRNSSRWSPSG